MAEIEKLIERLEKLTGPDRETDAHIASAAGLPMTFCDFDTGCYHGDCNSPGCGKPLGLSDERKSYPRDWQDDERLPHYTSSIDAALTLMPEGWRWFIEYFAHNKLFDVEIHDGKNGKIFGAKIPSNAAIALSIAALKARAALEKDSENEG